MPKASYWLYQAAIKNGHTSVIIFLSIKSQTASLAHQMALRHLLSIQRSCLQAIGGEKAPSGYYSGNMTWLR